MLLAGYINNLKVKMSKTKTLLVGIIFLLIGVGILTGDFFVIKSTMTFLSNSEKAEGSVIDIVKSRSSDGDYMYRPEISFIDTTGQTITFTSSISSSMPSYQVGEKVSVLYDKSNSQSAKINTFFQLWFGPIIMTVLGVIFFLTGLLILIKQKRKLALKNELLSRGTKISAKVISIETINPARQFDNSALRPLSTLAFGSRRSYNYRPNIQTTYQIIAQWLNTTDNQMYIFKSDDLTYNPESVVSGKDIDVYIDPINPQKYYMDISTLPKIGN